MKAGGQMNNRKRMVEKAKTQMIIQADTLEKSGWYRRPTGKSGAMDKLIDLLVKALNEACEIER